MINAAMCAAEDVFAWSALLCGNHLGDMLAAIFSFTS